MATSNLKTKRNIGSNPISDEILEEDTAPKLAALRPPEEALESIVDGLAEIVLEASDEELLAEAREESGDPTVQAERVRNVLLKAANKYEVDSELPPHSSHQVGSDGSS